MTPIGRTACDLSVCLPNRVHLWAIRPRSACSTPRRAERTTPTCPFGTTRSALFGRQTNAPRGLIMSVMTTAVVRTRGLLQAPRLRFHPANGPSARRRPYVVARPAEKKAPPLRLRSRTTEDARPVLLAGGAPHAREAVRRDLARSMSSGTVIEQVGAVWEVLARAGDSRVVIISGELDDVSPERWLGML